eukprot:7436625-Pyramimonas_sp.AAC.1
MGDGPYCAKDLNSQSFFGSQRAADDLVLAKVDVPTHVASTIGAEVVSHQRFQDCGHFFAVFVVSADITEVYDDLWG